MRGNREPLVSASFLEGYDAFASRRGLNYGELLSRARLDPITIRQPSNQISMNSLASLLTFAAEEASDPCLGIRWAQDFKPGTTGVLGYLLLNASSVRTAVNAIERYVRLLLDPVDVTYEEDESFGHLSFRLPQELSAPRIQYVSFSMALLIIRLRKHAGQNWMPVGVDLEHRRLDCTDIVERVLGPNVRYDNGINTLHIRKEVLCRSSDHIDRKLFDLIRELGERMLTEQKSETDIVQTARKAILDNISNGAVRLRDIAKSMGMEAPSLQSRLSTAGMNYEDLLVSTRRSLSDLYLRDTELPLTEIALLLGFSELSAFTRAAQRWYGAPPSQRRVELRK